MITVLAVASPVSDAAELGMILAWGDQTYGACDVPEPNEDFVAVEGGYYHGLGLKVDGSIAPWGINFYGECDLPEPNKNFVAIAGGQYFNLGLKTDGSVVAWGRNDVGQCDVPLPNEDYLAAAGGAFHSLGLKRLDPSTGACCIDDACIPTYEADCIATGGIYMGDGTNCADITCPEPCPADITDDGTVDVLDLLEVLSQWGSSGTADINADSIVDVLDLLEVLAAWGPC